MEMLDLGEVVSVKNIRGVGLKSKEAEQIQSTDLLVRETLLKIK